ncbi:hypothetical protein KAR91_54195 [Candidatus Pacearchaeota archaeon]|nr:hypothetical protein [Candidatus Pacearchaeota archaeon]
MPFMLPGPWTYVSRRSIWRTAGGMMSNTLTFHFEQVPGQLKWTGECIELGVGGYADTLMEARQITFELVMLHLKALRDVE